MRWKKVFLLLLTLVLLSSSSSAYAQVPPPLPALPVVTEYIHAGSLHYGYYISAKVHPRSGMLYLAYFNPADNTVELAIETRVGTGNCGRNHDFNCEILATSSQVGSVSLDITTYRVSVFSTTIVGIAYLDNANKQLIYIHKTDMGFPSNPSWVTENAGTYDWLSQATGQSVVLKYHPTTHLPVFAAQISNPTLGNPEGYVTWVTQPDDPNAPRDPDACGTNLAFICKIVDGGPGRDFGYPMDMDISSTGEIQIAYHAPVSNGLTAPPLLTRPAIILARYTPGQTNTSCTGQYWACTTIHGIPASSLSFHATQSSTDNLRIAALNPNTATLNLISYVGLGGGNADNPDYWVSNIQGNVGTDDWARIDLENDNDEMPVISYYARTGLYSGELRLARPKGQVPGFIANCGQVGPFLGWVCGTVDTELESAAHVPSLGGHSSLGIYPNGRLAVGYLRIDSGTMPMNALMVARSADQVFLPYNRR